MLHILKVKAKSPIPFNNFKWKFRENIFDTTRINDGKDTRRIDEWGTVVAEELIEKNNKTAYQREFFS